jgi:hypothetical protein
MPMSAISPGPSAPVRQRRCAASRYAGSVAPGLAFQPTTSGSRAGTAEQIALRQPATARPSARAAWRRWRRIMREQGRLLVEAIELPEAQPHHQQRRRARRSSVGTMGTRRVMFIHDPALARGIAIFEREQHALAETQRAEDQAQRDRRPQQDMQPEGRREDQLDRDRQPGDDRADDQREERRRPVADIERRIIEPAGGAAIGELGPAGKQACGRRTAGSRPSIRPGSAEPYGAWMCPTSIRQTPRPGLNHDGPNPPGSTPGPLVDDQPA